MPRILKPLARAVRGPILVRREGQALSRLLEEQLFRCADVLSEGQVRPGERGDAYFGSTMIAFDLQRLASHVVGGLGDEGRAQLLRLVDGSVRVRLRAMRLARAEAVRRVPSRPLGTAQVETRARLTRTHLHIDVDLEVPIGVSSRARRR